jgi:hypothetical protein
VLKNFQEIKSQKLFIKKRHRVIQSQYRDGILGVEQPGDKGSYFYSNKLIRDEHMKANRKQLRTACKLNNEYND